MSQENVEVIRRLLPGPDVDLAHALRNDDLWALASQAWAAVTHPDFETMIEVPSQSSTHVGVDGLREAWLDWVGPWETYYTEIEELIDAGDAVVAIVRDRARRKGVDAEVDLLGSNVSMFRDGRILRIGFYASRATALEAVGLSEQDDHAEESSSPSGS
jgi:ketosteroid isomerase-like protein